MTDLPPVTRHATGQQVFEVCGLSTVTLNLYDHENHVRAHEVYGKGGPWLLTAEAYHHYRILCNTAAMASPLTPA